MWSYEVILCEKLTFGKALPDGGGTGEKMQSPAEKAYPLICCAIGDVL